jgi:hypothetical protein
MSPWRPPSPFRSLRSLQGDSAIRLTDHDIAASLPASRGCSSAGRALQSHCRGQGFDPPQLHFRPGSRQPFAFHRRSPGQQLACNASREFPPGDEFFHRAHCPILQPADSARSVARRLFRLLISFSSRLEFSSGAWNFVNVPGNFCQPTAPRIRRPENFGRGATFVSRRGFSGAGNRSDFSVA